MSRTREMDWREAEALDWAAEILSKARLLVTNREGRQRISNAIGHLYRQAPMREVEEPGDKEAK